MEVKQEDMTREQRTQWEKEMQYNVCGVCGAELTIRTVPENASLYYGCSMNMEHTGLGRRTSLTQDFRRGEALPLPIKNAVEGRMLPGGIEAAKSIALIKARFPQAELDDPSAALFVRDCVRLDLDPFLGEIIPTSFKNNKTGRSIVVPIITEDGYLSMAARAYPEIWSGPPRTYRLEEYLMTQAYLKDRDYGQIKEVAADIKLDMTNDRDAHVWVAVGRPKDYPDDIVTYGWYKSSEKNPVASGLPGNQARVRAIKRWVREAYPAARNKMVEITDDLMNRAEGMKDVYDVIEAEYTVIDTKRTGPKPPEHDKQLEPPDALTTLEKWANDRYNLKPAEVYKKLGFASRKDFEERKSMTPKDAAAKLAEVMGEKGKE